jgi:molybdopterin-guanine dinucleotide biosynthesis protein A
LVTGETAKAHVAGFVLAGGGSTRFGRDKALVQIGGQSLMAKLCSVLLGVTPDVKIIGSREKYGSFGVECIADRWPGQGPLGGIVTALSATDQGGGGEEPARIPFGAQGKSARPSEPDERETSPCEWNLIIGCDMPFLTHEWLVYLLEKALASEAEVVAPKSVHGLEPLCACWRASSADKLKRVFEGGVRRVTEGMKHLSMEVLDETHWKRFDSADRLFWNMNTPADYDEAKRILESEPERA